jgi:hypothetical protein
MIYLIKLQYTIILLNLKNRKIPAATNVAECIKADAGTGASIESGNQK